MLSSKLSAAQPGTNRAFAHICCFWLELRGCPRANSLCGWLQHLASEARLIGKHSDPTLTHHSGPSLLCFVLFFGFVFQKGVTYKNVTVLKTPSPVCCFVSYPLVIVGFCPKANPKPARCAACYLGSGNLFSDDPKPEIEYLCLSRGLDSKTGQSGL